MIISGLLKMENLFIKTMGNAFNFNEDSEALRVFLFIWFYTFPQTFFCGNDRLMENQRFPTTLLKTLRVSNISPKLYLNIYSKYIRLGVSISVYRKVCISVYRKVCKST